MELGIVFILAAFVLAFLAYEATKNRKSDKVANEISKRATKNYNRLVK
jgi:hypothetical protein